MGPGSQVRQELEDVLGASEGSDQQPTHRNSKSPATADVHRLLVVFPELADVVLFQYAEPLVLALVRTGIVKLDKLTGAIGRISNTLLEGSLEDRTAVTAL